MVDVEINEVAKILSEWNPLGEDSARVKDLDGYIIEATDILSELQIRRGTTNAETIVMEVLNQAFGLALTRQECAPYARKIIECTRWKPVE